MAGKIEGTHNGNKSNVPNTCAPRQRKKPTKAERRLEARIKDFEKVKQPKTAFHKPGSMTK